LIAEWQRAGAAEMRKTSARAAEDRTSRGPERPRTGKAERQTPTSDVSAFDGSDDGFDVGLDPGTKDGWDVGFSETSA